MFVSLPKHANHLPTAAGHGDTPYPKINVKHKKHQKDACFAHSDIFLMRIESDKYTI